MKGRLSRTQSKKNVKCKQLKKRKYRNLLCFIKEIIIQKKYRKALNCIMTEGSIVR